MLKLCRESGFRGYLWSVRDVQPWHQRCPPSGLEQLFLQPRRLPGPQQRGCYWISNKRTNHGKRHATDRERPDNIPAFLEELVIVSAGEQMRVSQQFDTGGGNS